MIAVTVVRYATSSYAPFMSVSQTTRVTSAFALYCGPDCLVLGYVKGQTLADRLRSGSEPVRFEGGAPGWGSTGKRLKLALVGVHEKRRVSGHQPIAVFAGGCCKDAIRWISRRRSRKE